jgi:hypothetical protein
MYIIIVILFLCIYIHILKKNINNNIIIYNIYDDNAQYDVNNKNDIDIIIVYDCINISNINKKYHTYKFNNVLIYSKMKLNYNILYDKFDNFLMIIKYKNFYIYIINNNPIINNYYANSIYLCINRGHNIYKYLKKISNTIYINQNLKYNIYSNEIIKIHTKY